MKTDLIAFLAVVAGAVMVLGLCLFVVYLDWWRRVRKLERDLGRLKAAVDRDPCEREPDA